jgi:hypothetical protein
MGNLVFAPGETNISEEHFSSSLLFFWLKTEMAVTSQRFVSKRPNRLLGVIPLGYQDVAFPLHNVASAGVGVKFSLLRALFGALFFIGGLGGLSQNVAVGVLFIIWGLVLLSSMWTATLVLVNNGGGASAIRVSILSKAKLEHFRDEVNQRLFSDHAGLRHNDVMGAQALSVMLQQQQLLALQAMQQNQYGVPPGGQPSYPGIPAQQWGPPAPQPASPPALPAQPWSAPPAAPQPWTSPPPPSTTPPV